MICDIWILRIVYCRNINVEKKMRRWNIVNTIKILMYLSFILIFKQNVYYILILIYY